MSSEFLIAVPHELPKQDNLIKRSTEEKILDEDYTNNHLEQKLSLSVPEFTCFRNFPFSKSIKFGDMPVPNHAATKRHTLDDELEARLPKLIKLQPEFTNYPSETAVDMVDAVRSQVIKNDINLGEILENPSINKNERTDPLVEETSLQQLANETMDNSDNGHDCPTLEDGSCSDKKSSDQQQGFSKMETESAELKIQNVNESSASLVTGQAIETENMLLNTEKRIFFPHEFVGAETESDEYHSVHDSFSLSEFLICPTSFEQKDSCDALLVPVQKEEPGGSVTAAADVSTGMEKVDTHPMLQSEILGHASTSFALDNKSVGNDAMNSTAHQLCETRKLSHNAEEGNRSNLLENKISESVEVPLGQTVVKEEFHIKQEVEEDPILHTIQVPNVDLLHNRELDLVDDTVFQNWFMSLVNQETVPESVSTSTYGHHESLETEHTEDLHRHSRIAYKENLALVLAKSAAAKEYPVEPQTKSGNEIIDRNFPLPGLIGKSGDALLVDRLPDRSDNCSEENDTRRFLQSLFPDVTDIPPAQKVDTSFDKVKNACEELMLTDLSAPILPRSGVAQGPITNVEPLENKSEFAATSECDDNNSAKPESDIIRKHHKKELIKKFSSGLLKDVKCDMKSTQGNKIQNETVVTDSALPSTSNAATNEEKCVKDCIVISDSDDDSIIEFNIVKTCTKKRSSKSTHSATLGKNNQSNSRRSIWNTKGSTNEESLGQQRRNSIGKSNVTMDCIVLSDSDDESSKLALSSRNRASNRFDEGANVSDSESRVSVSDVYRRNRSESHGVIDLSGGRSPSATLKNNSAIPLAGDNSVGVFATSFSAGDSQCSLRVEAHNSGLDSHNNNPFTHIVAATITYNSAQSNLGSESNGDVIDLRKRNFPLVTSWQNKTNIALDILDLSGSDKKQQERHSVIKSVGSATENKSTTKGIGEDKDSSPAWSCPICFESLLSGKQSVSSTPCGHVFCTKCIEEAVNQFKKCPTCCRKVALKRVHKIFF